MKHHGMTALAMGLLIACQADGESAPTASQDGGPEAPITLTLVDGVDGPWTLEVSLNATEPVFFSRSAGNYRTGTYSPQNEGADLQRIGGFDVITVDESGIARFQINPYSESINAEYTPFIPFTDGGVALFTGQFELLPTTDFAAIEMLDGRLSNWSGEQRPIPLTLSSDRTMLIDGLHVSGDATVMVNGGGEYIYFGDAPLVDGENFVGVLDPGLPDWIREDFDDTLGTIFTALGERFGYGLPDKATVLFAYRGDDIQGLSNKGGALPGNVLALETAGTALRQPNDAIMGYFQFFFAHEAAHLFQQASGQTLGNQNAAWIHEGHASAVAYRLLVEQGIQTREDYETRLANVFERCANELDGRALSETLFTGYVGAYDCGELISVASDAALPDHDLFDLWAELTSGVDDERHYDETDYFAALETLGADAGFVSELRILTQETLPDGELALLSLLKAANLVITIVDMKVSRIAMVE